MSPIVLVLLIIPIVFVALAILSRNLSGGAALAMRLLTTVSALPMLAFFIFGFLATFEPVDSAMLFRVIYIALFATVSATVIFTWIPKSAKSQAAVTTDAH